MRTKMTRSTTAMYRIARYTTVAPVKRCLHMHCTSFWNVRMQSNQSSAELGGPFKSAKISMTT